ncbi:helix-turn-helix transcriptional regulator [Enterobacter hormaechei subsp. hoffmannii]|uniref:helix-turn-helix domain-containing protein n=1 Tax=Enterobacter hormaechei TaxID=158836 RepID=UPI000F81D106|nr:helix-turn-helix transcriptional regulator [Enterobacter hormaechei]MCU2425972.1 helix-turn-helix transcriptional regulator [Enterobacter hormaechei subsp. hoffmannii]ELC7230187.1 helix-turn-helix transcriptional regulator [Enterobacter hormaechei]MBJ6500478.1 helix-turn-helix transcriptional regulator [Enterobacter hormaechei]MCU2953686.1 helix-turn-helix transcriptional regulator [Enterobacter hormaechei subsp. hoffmannii]MCU3338060.1 helix-turn-helix transcriptional regulator [Enterobact
MLTTERLVHPGGYHTPWHSHHAGQLWRIAAGLLVIETPLGRSVVPAKHIGWIPPGQQHAAFSESAIEGCAVYLDPAHCEGLPEKATLFESDDFTDALFSRLSVAGSEYDPRKLILLLEELVLASQVRFYLPVPTDPRLKNVVRKLLQSVDDNQTVESHASRAGMSVRTFNRRFSAETGMNFVNWRQLARVMQAMEWLAAGKPVGWIALSCGYSSVSAFIEVFRTWTGKTPGQWTIKEGPFAQR